MNGRSDLRIWLGCLIANNLLSAKGTKKATSPSHFFVSFVDQSINRRLREWSVWGAVAAESCNLP